MTRLYIGRELLLLLPLLLATVSQLSDALSVHVSPTDSRSLIFSQGGMTVENRILGGDTHDSLAVLPVSRRQTGSATQAEPKTPSAPRIQWENITPEMVRVRIESDEPVTGASFAWGSVDSFYGVWEYPFNGTVSNRDVSFDVKGLFGDQPGVNYANARAPFFFTRSGFGVYVDTLKMGRFEFASPNRANFTFDSTDITYTVMHKSTPKELLMQYMNLSSKPVMPIESGYGPIFWSDDMEQDFHGPVSNAEENYYGIVDHLFYNKIRATGMFADRPYGTGNWSFGNFDFDPAYFPNPATFIANLTKYGFDFQVWVANRAFLKTQLYNDSIANGWLFPDIDGTQFLGPALNLSIPEAYAYFLKKLEVFPKMGVTGYKIDRGEENEMPDSEQNVQMDLFLRLCEESMTIAPGAPKKHFSFARSAVDRSRSTMSLWNGDAHATYEGLRYSVASGIRSGLIGFSHWGSDTGGYVRPANDTPSEELWARWMHFSAWSPMYEIMVGTGHTPWYAPYTSALVEVLRHTADLHTRLVPYMRSLAWDASTGSGLPAMRALFLEFPADGDAVYSGSAADTQFLLGPSFLVAPIVDAGGSREVYFPGNLSSADDGTNTAATRWLEWYNKTAVHVGGTRATVSLPLSQSPVYVREGSIVALGDVYRGNALWDADWKSELAVEVYPSYSVTRGAFAYYTGAGVVDITVTTDKGKQTVVVAWDAPLGVDVGSVLIYGKGGVTNVSMPAGGLGKSVKLDQFESLFD